MIQPPTVSYFGKDTDPEPFNDQVDNGTVDNKTGPLQDGIGGSATVRVDVTIEQHSDFPNLPAEANKYPNVAQQPEAQPQIPQKPIRPSNLSINDLFNASGLWDDRFYHVSITKEGAIPVSWDRVGSGYTTRICEELTPEEMHVQEERTNKCDNFGDSLLMHDSLEAASHFRREDHPRSNL